MKGSKIRIITKLTSCISVIALIVSCCVFASNGDVTYSDDEIQNRFEVFRVINYESPTFSEDGTLTRGKMAEIIGRLQGFGTPNTMPPIEDCFNDVSYTHSQYYWILIAKNNFLINGDGNACFKPDEKVTEIDAVKMLLTFAGYDWMAEACGGYPQGYADAAKILRLTGETDDLTAVPMTKDKLLRILNSFIDLRQTAIDENGKVILSAEDERTGGNGTMKDWLKLNAYGIKDPFEVE